MVIGYVRCPCDIYEPGPDGICLDAECGHDAHQHNIEVGDHEACLAQEGDPPGCFLPLEDTKTTGTRLALPSSPVEGAGAGPAVPPLLPREAGRPSNHPSATSGECLTPGTGAADVGLAVTESAAVLVARSAGADARRAEGGDSPSARLGFTLPRPPEFQIGGADYRDLLNDAANRRAR